MEDKRLTLSVLETARILSIGRNNCYAQVKAGTIPCLKFGRCYRIPRHALEKLLAEGKLPKATESEGQASDQPDQ